MILSPWSMLVRSVRFVFWGSVVYVAIVATIATIATIYAVAAFFRS